jgi:membrane protein DedA with SNARE-associated domain
MKTELPVPKRPFRDSLVFYAILSGIFVLVVWATGGAVLPRYDDKQHEFGGLVIAIAFFLLATGYSWWRFKRRIEREEAQK